MLVRNIHLGIVNRVYDGIARQCQQGTLNVFVCGKLEGDTWIGCLTQEVSVEVSRRIVMEKALIFYPMYWLWKLKMWCEGESSCYQGSGYNVQLQIE